MKSKGWEALIIFAAKEQMLKFAVERVIAVALSDTKPEVLPGEHSTGLLIRGDSPTLLIRGIYERAIKAGATDITIKWKKES